MLDALCTLGMLAFFGFLIYSTMMREPKKSSMPGAAPTEPLPPSPVGLFCSLCHAPAVLVNNEEYARLAKAGTKVYCERCTTTVEAYKQQEGRK